MSKDSLLKKEFGKKEVQRVRNIMTGNSSDRVGSSVGYSKTYVDRKEGDVWEEGGRTWMIKDGIKQSQPKLDKSKLTMPLFCPNCSSVMNHRLDKVYYPQHGKCYDCVIEFETTLKIEGKWEQYQKDLKNQEIDHKIAEFKAWAKERATDMATSYLTEDGDIEKWKGGELTEEQIEKNIQEVVEYLENLKT